MDKDQFKWPWQYNFPPFFTLQSNKDVLKTQLDTWCSLVISWGKHNNIVQIDVTEAPSLPVFNNPSIKRSLPSNSINVVLDELTRRGNLEWTDKSKRRAMLFWRSPAEWGQKIYSWAQNTGHVNSVCTWYELTQGEDTTGEDFHNLDEAILQKALMSLASDGKAEIMNFEDSKGVKFF